MARFFAKLNGKTKKPVSIKRWSRGICTCLKACILKGATNHVSLRGASYSRYRTRTYVRTWLSFSLGRIESENASTYIFAHSRRAVKLKKQREGCKSGGIKGGKEYGKKGKTRKTDRAPSPTEVTQRDWKGEREIDSLSERWSGKSKERPGDCMWWIEREKKQIEKISDSRFSDVTVIFFFHFLQQADLKNESL